MKEDLRGYRLKPKPYCVIRVTIIRGLLTTHEPPSTKGNPKP